MSIELSTLRRLRVKVEAAGSYAVDDTSTPSNFDDVAMIEGTFQGTRDQAELMPNISQVFIDAIEESEWGPKTNTVGFSTFLYSHGQDLDGDVTAITDGTYPPIDMEKAVFGGRSDTSNESAQTTVQASPTPTASTFTVTAGHGVRFPVGNAIGITIGGVYQVREVLSVSTDAITVKEAFSAAPDAAAVCRGSVTTYLTEDPDTSLQFLVEGREASDGFGHLGCQATSLGYTFEFGQLIQMAWQFSGSTWVGPQSATIAAQDLSSYSGAGPIQANPLTLHVYAFTAGSAATLTNICPFSSIEITPNITFAPVTCGSATDNISRMRRQRSGEGAAAGAWVEPFEDGTEYTGWSSKTDYGLTLQCGNTVGATVLISLPTIQIVNVQEAEATTGIRGQQVSFKARHDSHISSPSSELQRSPIRIHRL